jgi:hypothetical protein
MFKPCCDEDSFPDLCGKPVDRCLHCMAECICDRLRACEARVTIAAVQRVEALEYISTIGVTLSSVVPKAAVIAAIKGDQE